MKTEIGLDVEKASGFLKEGRPVGVPTETVYGLAGIISNPRGISAIFDAKNRPNYDPLIIHGYNENYLFEKVCVEVPKEAYALAKAFWPGPLTLVLKKDSSISEKITAGLDTVAIRVPAHPLFRSLLKVVNEGLAAPSANPFGFISPTNAEHVYDQLQGKIPYILDGGKAKIGLESTIINITQKPFTILRPGAITAKEISQVIGEEVRIASKEAKIIAPGTLERHYSPLTPTLDISHLKEFLLEKPKSKVGIVAFSHTLEDIPISNQVVLSKTKNLTEAAQNFYAGLRKLDKLELDVIFIDEIPKKGIGIALNDRRKRALKT